MVVKAAILRAIVAGKIPDGVAIQGNLPSNFQKDETLVWLFKNVRCYRPLIKLNYLVELPASSPKASAGVYYRAADFENRRIPSLINLRQDTGFLGVFEQTALFQRKSEILQPQLFQDNLDHPLCRWHLRPAPRPGR